MKRTHGGDVSVLFEIIPALLMQEHGNSAAKADSSAKSATSAAPAQLPSGSPRIDAATNPFATPSEDTSNTLHCTSRDLRTARQGFRWVMTKFWCLHLAVVGVSLRYLHRDTWQVSCLPMGS